MDNLQKNQTAITEADVVFYDIDPVLYGDHFRVKPTPNSFWAGFSFSEFAGWLQDCGRIDHADNDREYISVDGVGYSYQKFWRELVISREADELIRQFIEVDNQKRDTRNLWIADIRAPQPAGEYPATGYTPDQEAALYEYHDMNDFSHPNEKP